MLHSNITDTLEENYMPYSAYVILDRALPEIDGLKPSQRRILYTMFKMGLLNGDDEDRKKSQGIVGQTMFLHPHGDGAIYDTLVRMTKDAESLLIPYINSKGNFGKQYSKEMQPASARYTEVKLANVAKELFADINKNTVEMIDNYDGTMKEPRLLPVTFPNILTNPQSGMAVGMASSIASFNINEVIDATIAYIKNPKLDITEHIQAPDFPSGGNIVYDKETFDRIINTGRGSFNIRATYRIEGNSIFFEEMPYTATFEAITDKIVGLVKEGKMKEVVDVHDNYGINSQGIEVVVRGNVNKEDFVEKLYRMTPLQSSFSCNFNMIVNGSPKVMGVKEIIHEWIGFRVDCIRKGAQFELNKTTDRLHFLMGLKKVMLDIDKTISIIRETKTNSEVIANLMKEMDLDERQAELVADIRLKHLNVEYLQDRVSEMDTLEKEIASLNDLITNKRTLANLIINQLKRVKKEHGQERKSKIITVSTATKSVTDVKEIDNYNLKIFMTKDGYLKKIPLTSLRGSFAIKVKDGDEVRQMIETTNASDILVFTDKQNVYKLKTHELEDHKPSVLGEYLPSLLGLKNENIVYTTVTTDYKGDLLIGFDDGKVAKIEMKAYETKQNRSMLKNAYATKKALYFKHITEDVDILAVSSIKKGLVFNTAMVNAKASKTTQGVQVMKEKKDSRVISYHTLAVPHEESDYYRVSSAGVGKYLRKEDFGDVLGKQESLDLN